MTATPSSADLTDVEPSSSPLDVGRSYMTHATANSFIKDEDDNDSNTPGRTSRMIMDTPDASERRSGHGGRSGGGGGGGGSSRSRGARGSTAAGDSSIVGANNNGNNGSFKDPSAIGKIRHLKKEDGEPLWRSDIQYALLRAIFDDEHKVFTNSYEPETIGKQCFADLYIDTMARSSKTSKILHDKLLSDREAAKSMAMVCLLVNIGRMNTTLNFFPEMRAQLRTYHAIPSLQAHQDEHAYKQLQDAPRLKSILKGGTEDRPEPRTLEALKEDDVPRTNPVNLIFLICNSAAKVAELHFPPGREFHDLIMRTNYSSQSRARAFLWIMWFYLESDFTEEGCEENPFGAGVDYGVDVANQGVPVLEELTPEEEADENRDTPFEREFGMIKKKLRFEILRSEHHVDVPTHKRSSRQYSRPSAAAAAAAAAAAGGHAKEPVDDARARSAISRDRDATAASTDHERSVPPAILPRIRPSKHESDVDSTRSTPPPRGSLIRSFGAGGGMGSFGAGAGAGTARRAGPLKYQIVDGSSPARQPPLIQQLHQQQQSQQARRRRKQQQKAERPLQDSQRQQDDEDEDGAGTRTPVAAPGGRKPRPPTAHQIAVENNRKQRIEYLLSQGMHRKHHRARKARRTEGAIIRALRRLDHVDDPFEDSENEDNLEFNRGLFSFQLGSAQTMPTGNAFRERGFFGLVQLKEEETDDFGEEFANYAAAVRRACRRLNRWEGTGVGVVAPVKRPRVDDNGGADDEFRDPNETEEEQDLMMDADMSMSLLDVLPPAPPPPPPPKRRRTTGGAAGRSRGAKTAAAGGAAGAPTAVKAGRPTTVAGRRRRAGPTAVAASKTNGNNDVTMRDADNDDVDVDDGDGADNKDAEAEDDARAQWVGAATAAAAKVAKPRVTIKRPKPAVDQEREEGEEEVEEDENDEEEDDDGDDDEDELNDVDKTLLGMGDGDTDSE
ncbi:ino eighty subunit 1 [Niveomyces insectorum RCEF 264]|uniref:Ino eighty subunit 1 n=1 Tax=Niveomyces insectorum RCEF 264 TaxID=1081102 RepID=A0A167X7H3_9HYPO|nr:ino eighty subunit 1 [Niveomyces insectorum RCEF 264]